MREAAERRRRAGDLQDVSRPVPRFLHHGQAAAAGQCRGEGNRRMVEGAELKRRSAPHPKQQHTFYPALAARRSDCGGWPKARMKARRIRAGWRKPVDCATRSIASLDDCTRCRAASMRRRSTALDGVAPVSAMKARAKCRELMPA